MSNKILLFRGSPRSNIEEVENYNIKLEKVCDVLNIRYMQEIPAYANARRIFLQGKWDYFVIATDDIVVTPEHVEQLKEDLTDHDVIGGMMNVDQTEYMKEDGNLNICYELALKDRKLRFYNWIKRNGLPEDDIFKVKFNGFALLGIKRDIIKDIEFAGDGIFRGKNMKFGASLDFVFCWDCHIRNIPVFVDKRIDMKHLRTSGTHQVGLRKPEIWLNNELLNRCSHNNKIIKEYNNRPYAVCNDCDSFC